MQLKLDELIRAINGAHNGLLDLEELSDEELDKIKSRYEELARQAREELRRGLMIRAIHTLYEYGESCSSLVAASRLAADENGIR
jgi:low affinity Fe/Cu permease